MIEVFNFIPWLVLLAVFGVMALLQWRLINALDEALKRLSPQPVVAPEALPASAPKSATAVPATSAPAAADTGAPIDEALVVFVKKEEGFKAHAYPDYKQYSIGYGTKAASATEVIDEAEGDTRLRAELAACQKSVDAFCPIAPKGVKQALIDLTYNAGPAWEAAELGKLIKAGDYETAKAHVLQYNHAGGVVNAGLTARRQAEVSWFDHPL